MLVNGECLIVNLNRVMVNIQNLILFPANEQIAVIFNFLLKPRIFNNYFKAAWKVFINKAAMVINPTPPGTGVM